MQLASFVQQKFYPPKDISIPGWDISAIFKPLSNVSGDLYDFFIAKEKLEGFCLFDVSGHGVAAGLVTMIAKNIIYKNFKEGTKKNLEQVIYGINNDIISSKGQIENYLTGLLFRYNQKNNTFEFVNAGHPHPFLYKKENDTVAELSTEKNQYGMIGVSDLQVLFPAEKEKINTDDIIVCFTDGITETENFLREQFGTERLTKIIHDNKDKTSKEIGDIILHEIKTFAGCVALQDDITIIVLKKQNPDDYIPLI